MPIKCCGLFGSQKKPGKEKQIFKKMQSYQWELRDSPLIIERR
jgi:hypothetical protein